MSWWRREGKDKSGSKPGSGQGGEGKKPNPSMPGTEEPGYEQLQIERGQWEELHVPYGQVELVSKTRVDNGYGGRITPAELRNTTMALNQILKKNGYKIQVTFHQTLGMIADEMVLASKQKKMPLPHIAIWKVAEARVKNRHNLGPKVILNVSQQEELRVEFEDLNTQAKDRVSGVKAEEFATQSARSLDDDRPELGELIKSQAKVMAKRKNKKLPDDDPQKFEGDNISSEVMAAEIEQAKVDYRKMHKLPEDWESQYW